MSISALSGSLAGEKCVKCGKTFAFVGLTVNWVEHIDNLHHCINIEEEKGYVGGV